MATSRYQVTVTLTTAGKTIDLTLDEHDLRQLRAAVAIPDPACPAVTVGAGEREITIRAASVAVVDSSPANF